MIPTNIINVKVCVCLYIRLSRQNGATSPHDFLNGDCKNVKFPILGIQ